MHLCAANCCEDAFASVEDVHRSAMFEKLKKIQSGFSFDKPQFGFPSLSA